MGQVQKLRRHSFLGRRHGLCNTELHITLHTGKAESPCDGLFRL